MDIGSWLREFLSSRMDEEAIARVLSRIPPYLLRGDSSAIGLEGTDYESLEGLRLLLSVVGRALLDEGEAGIPSLADLLSLIESGGGARSEVVRWYRSILKVSRGIEVRGIQAPRA